MNKSIVKVVKINKPLFSKGSFDHDQLQNAAINIDPFQNVHIYKCCQNQYELYNFKKGHIDFDHIQNVHN